MSLRIGLFSALAAAVTAASAAAQAPARPSGVDVVPSSSFAFASVKVSDLWDAPALKDARDVLTKQEPNAAKELEKATGLTLDEIERVTVFLPAVSFGQAPYTIVTTRKPYNEAKLLRALRAQPFPLFNRHGHAPGLRRGGPAFETVPAVKEAVAPDAPEPPLPGAPPQPAPPPPVKKFAGDDPCGQDEPAPAKPGEKAADADDAPDLLFIEGGPFAAVFLLDDRNVLFLPNPEGGFDAGSGSLALVGQLLRKRGDGPLAEAMALAGKHTVVVATRVSAFNAFMKGFPGPGAFPPEIVPYRSLLATRTAVLTADVADTATLNVKLTFANANDARRAEPVLATLFQVGEEFLKHGRAEAAKDEDTAPLFLPLIDLATQALAKATVKADGAAVTAKLEADFGPAVAKAVANAPKAIQAAATRTQTQNNLKQIGLAIHNYHDANGRMPTDILDKNGTPILSWRVQLLPYLEQGPLYNQLDLTKSWDDPANKKFLEQMPPQYQVVGRETKDKGLTYLQMPTSDKPTPGGSPFHVRGQKVTFASITDGLSNTLMVVEAADPVLWMKPDDLPFDPKTLPKLGGPKASRFSVLLGDGSVRDLKRATLTDDALRAALTRDGGETVPLPD